MKKIKSMLFTILFILVLAVTMSFVNKSEVKEFSYYPTKTNTYETEPMPWSINENKVY